MFFKKFAKERRGEERRGEENPCISRKIRVYIS
jgi:hypothetical protein